MKAILASLMFVSVAAFANPPVTGSTNDAHATTDAHAKETTTTTTTKEMKKDAKASSVDCMDKKNSHKPECKTTK